MGSESEVVLWPGLLVGEAVRRPAETEVSPPVGEVGWSQKAGVVPPRPDLPVDNWIAVLAYHSDTWAEPLLGSRSARDPRFMNPIGAPEPPGDLGKIV